MPALWNRLTEALQKPQVLGRQGGARTKLWKKFHALTGLPAPGEGLNEAPEVLSDAPGSPLQAFTPLLRYTLPALTQARRGLMTIGGKVSTLGPGETHDNVFDALFHPGNKAPGLLGRLRAGALARFTDDAVEANEDFLLSPQGQDLLLSRAQRALGKGKEVLIDVSGKDKNSFGIIGYIHVTPEQLIDAGGDLSRVPDRAVQKALRGEGPTRSSFWGGY